MTKLPPDDLWNPYQAPEVAILSTLKQSSVAARCYWLKLCIGLQLLVVVVGLGLASWEIESIMGSGPVLAAIGLLTAIVSSSYRHKWGILFGVSAPLFSLLVFCLIYFLQWSTSEAWLPVLMMAGAYLFVGGLIAFVVFLQIRAREESYDNVSVVDA